MPLSVRPLPPRRLADLECRAQVVATESVGYLGAAAEDQRTWAGAFRAVLDGLDYPIQVVIDSAPGCSDDAADLAAFQANEGHLPAPPLRRLHDLAFAYSLSRRPSAQWRRVRLAAKDALAADRLARALAGAGVPGVRPHAWQPNPGLALGVELPGAVHDEAGWHRSWYVDRYPGGDLEPGWLLRLVPAGLPVSLSWHAEPLPTAWVVDYLQRQMVNMRANLLQHADGSDDPTVAAALPAAAQLQQRLIGSEESAFFVSTYLTVSVRAKEELAGASTLVDAAARSTLCSIAPCDFRQLDGRIATLPLCRDALRRRRVLHTSALVTLFPWFDADLQQSSGVVVGSSRATGQPVVVDPFDERRFANANVGIFGHSGAGKTYLMSTLAVSALSLGAQVFVIDPEHEYGGLARRLGGVDVKLALGSGHALNVLDLRGDLADEAVLGPATADAVDLCASICGDADEAERAQLEAAVRLTLGAVAQPVLSDVMHRLDPASRLATVLGRWVSGSLGQMFNRPTNVDLDAPIIAFGMRELRPELVRPVHYLLAEALWARIKNRDQRHLLVVDELGLLFEDPTIRQFVVALARRIRKYNGALVFATQNPGDLLGSEAGTVVATNPAIHFFGAQRPGEASRLQGAFNLSDQQRAGLEAARRGEFLLTAGADRIPLLVTAPRWQEVVIRGSG